ncbi:hypothetical protein [uncultured Thalassolituus sp.]|jgi:homoserine dehydrogenase|uniref:hypothetical protein n=1 Tax=Alteromonas australica TaxID=589873 RepID=UPI0032B11675|tara:strand:- start:983 stop:1996 length:1014 start_codon:yes stop_codon:yes gene_type:complete
MAVLNVAITGLGSVGQQIVKILSSRRDYYLAKYHYDIRIVGVCNSTCGLISEHGLALHHILDKSQFTEGLTGLSFINTVSADILIEAGPTDLTTGEPGLSYIRTALTRKMKVVCLSKGALVHDVASLLQLARQHATSLLFSGATASALPTMDLLQVSLAGCHIKQVKAILTGTTNMILSEMMDVGCSFDEALQKARELGIAETDPSLDTQGWDTANKITIIANAVFDAKVKVIEISRDGIEHITQGHISEWKTAKLTPRLIGAINNEGPQPEVAVKLELFSQHHPFAKVNGRTKAIHVDTDEMGELFVMGGASSLQATAAAALKDLELIIRTMVVNA